MNGGGFLGRLITRSSRELPQSSFFLYRIDWMYLYLGGSTSGFAWWPVWVSSLMRRLCPIHRVANYMVDLGVMSRYDIFAINIASTMIGYIYGGGRLLVVSMIYSLD